MEINDARNKKCMTYFDDLEPGDVFEWRDAFLMKTEEIKCKEGVSYYAVDVANGILTTIEADTFVTPLVVQLRIVRNG